MITANDVDWSKAPEDAEFSRPHNMLYKIQEDQVFYFDWNEDVWVLSAHTPDIRYHETSIPRPCEQTIQQTAQVNVQMNKPPIGLMPKHIFIEQMQMQRRNEITAAMLRYIEVGKDIPNDWLQELIELNNVIQNVQPEAMTESRQRGWNWVENTQAKDYHPPTLSPQAYIEVVYRDGPTDTGIVADWECCWNTTDNSNQDIVRYRILGDEE